MRSIVIHLLLAVLLCGCDRPQSSTSDEALRIVTLAPHLTELVFTAGAEEYLVGVSAYSDYPPAALEIPVISDAFTVDQEQLAVLAPTLILAWDGGNPRPLIDELSAVGYRVEAIRTHGLEDIPLAIERVGELTNTGPAVADIASSFRARADELRAAYSSADTVSVFYQISSRPLYTVGGSHYISDIIELCGGRNVFADLGELAPTVSVEAVIDRNPDVMLAADFDGVSPFEVWDRWPHLRANQAGNRFTVDGDAIGRASARLLGAAEEVCEHLASARRADDDVAVAN